MLFSGLATLFLCFVISTFIECRDIGKNFKTMPTISNSLVNLGKMDVSIYFNAKETPLKPDSYLGPSSSFLFSKSEPIEEPCPCSSLKGIKDPFSQSPSDFLNKLLMSNDLFSYKEPMTSTMCCDSHEHDDFVTFELGKHMSGNPFHPNLGSIPLIFDNLLNQKVPASSISRPKALEIFLFPKKKDSLFMPAKNNILKKESIQIVGDKELRNDFNNIKFKPTASVSSVKKDLTAQEKNDMKNVDDVEEIQELTTINKNSLMI